MKKLMQEFKTFALRGNMLDMAVGVMIGGAFTTVVTSLTENFFKPILNLITGGATYTLQDVARFASSFLSALVNFLITAVVLFLLMKGINTLMHLGRKEKEKPVVTKVCPFCRSEIALEATRCPHCTSLLAETVEEDA